MSLSGHQHVDSVHLFDDPHTSSRSNPPNPGEQFTDQLAGFLSTLKFGHDNVFNVDPKALEPISSELKLGFGQGQNFITSHQLAQLLKAALNSGKLDSCSAQSKTAINTAADYLGILNHVKSGQLGFDASCNNKGSTISNPSLQSAIAAMALKDLNGTKGNTLSTSDQSACSKLLNGIAGHLKNTLGCSTPSSSCNPPSILPTPPSSSDTPPSSSDTPPSSSDKPPSSGDTPPKPGNGLLTDLLDNPSGNSDGLFKVSADALAMTRKSDKKENSAAILNKKHEILSALAANGLITLEKNSDGSINTEKTLNKIPANSTAGFVMSLFFMEGIKRDDLKDSGDSANGYLNISEVVYRMAGFAGTPSELAQKAKNSGPIEAVNVLNKALIRATATYGNTKDGIEMILRGIRGGGSGAMMTEGTTLPTLAKLNEQRMADNFQTNKYIKVFMQHWASIVDDPTLMYNDVRLWDDVPYV